MSDEPEITILFAFYCDNGKRRSYIHACLNSIKKQIMELGELAKTVVIDGSPASEARKNEQLFNELLKYDLKYIKDETPYMTKRIENCMSEIKGKYVLRLIEDCIFYCGDATRGIKKTVSYSKNLAMAV